MFTQCSNCNTVFELSAEVLRAAGGQVRCGRCGEIFNALARLAEDSSTFDVGESAYELEERADSILESVPPDPLPPLTPDLPENPNAAAEEEYGSTEIAQLQVLDFSQDGFIDESIEDLVPEPEPEPPESALEFTLPPGELDRIFIETRPNSLQALATESRRSERARAETPSSVLVPATHEAGTPDGGMLSGAAAREDAPTSRIAGLEVSEDVRREMLKSYAHAELPDIDGPRRGLPLAAWLAGAILLGLLLAAQVVYDNLDWLAYHAHLPGNASATSGNLSSYQLRQWGVSGDPGAKGILRVRASILNAAPQLQPYPLLRVTLADRFGTHVGAREFEPAEYLGKPPARMLAPGERVDAVLDILDPGKDAEGFEIDVCVRDAIKKVHCASDAAARTP